MFGRSNYNFYNNSTSEKSNAGFTLIELLVVIAIIGLLASVVLVALNGTRSKAKIVKAQADLKQLRTAMAFLESDIGKWPNGCPIETIQNPEVFLDTDWAGIKARPPTGQPDPTYAPDCIWTAADQAKWKGPYANNTVDPWGNSYYFDPDYCDENAQTRVAILSFGPDKMEQYKSASCAGGSPNSDDILIYIK